MSSPALITADARYRLIRCIKLYRREQLPNIDKLLTRNKDDPVGLFRGITDNYGPEPAPEPLVVRVRRFLELHDKEALASAGDIAKANEDKPGECMAKLCDKYRVPEEPDPPTPRDTVATAVAPVSSAAAVGSVADYVFKGGPYPAASRPREEQRAAVVEFYRKYRIDKTDREIDASLDKYQAEGYDKMWVILDNKYATPPTKLVDAPESEQRAQLEKLRAFYQSKGMSKTDEEMRPSIERYAKVENGGYDTMWTILHNKYGPPAATSTTTTAAASPPQPNDDLSEKEANRIRLRNYYAAKQQAKTEEDIENSLQRYSTPESGGYTTMWQILENKYGPEDPEITSKLRAFFNAKGIEKSDKDLSEIITLHQRNGYDKMWVMLETKYGTAPPGGSESSGAPTAAFREEQKRRLTRYYKHYNVERTEAELDVAITKASEKVNGFDKLWKLLIGKYGPEPPPTPELKPVEARPSLNPTAAAPTTTNAAVTPQGDNPTDPLIFARLKNYYARYDNTKKDDDIRNIMERYSKGAGYAAMWTALTAKYGPEPTGNAEPVPIKDRLQRFYAHYKVDKTNAELDQLIAKYQTAPGGFDTMWASLEKKYGPEPVPLGERDTIRLDNFFVTPRGYRKMVEQVKQSQPDVKMPPNVHETALSTTALRHDQPYHHQQRHHVVIDDFQRRHRNAAESLVHFTLYINGVEYDRYEKADEARRAAFRQAIADQLAANAAIPVKLLTVTRVAHGPMIVDLDYEVPAGSEDQAVAVAELLSRKVDSGSFHVGLLRDAYRRHLGGNPVQLVVAGLNILSQGRLQEHEGMQHHQTGVRYGNMPEPTLQTSAPPPGMAEYWASLPTNRHRAGSPQRGENVDRQLNMSSPQVNDMQNLLLSEVRRDANMARAVEQRQQQQMQRSQLQQLLAQRAAPSMQQQQQQQPFQQQADAFGYYGGGGRMSPAGQSAMMMQPPPGYAAMDGSPTDTRDRFRDAVKTQVLGRDVSPYRAGNGSFSPRGGDYRNSLEQQAPQQAPNHVRFLEDLWAHQQGIVRRGPAVPDRTPAALQGLGLTTTNPIETHPSYGPSDMSGLLAPPGAMEFARMQMNNEALRRSAEMTHRKAYGLAGSDAAAAGPQYLDANTFSSSQAPQRGTAAEWRAARASGRASSSASAAPWAGQPSSGWGMSDSSDLYAPQQMPQTSWSSPGMIGYQGARTSQSPAPSRPGYGSVPSAVAPIMGPGAASTRQQPMRGGGGSGSDANYMYSVVDALNRR